MVTEGEVIVVGDVEAQDTEPADVAYEVLCRQHHRRKLTAARAIPFHKKQDGQGLRFHRDELDAWTRDQYPRLDHLA